MSETKEAEDHISIEVPRMSRLIYNLLAAEDTAPLVAFGALAEILARLCASVDPTLSDKMIERLIGGLPAEVRRLRTESDEENHVATEKYDDI